MTAPIRADGDGVLVEVLVQPRASRERLGPVHQDRLKLAVHAPPVDGEANAAVLLFFARALGVPRSAVSIERGQSSRRKTIRIDGITPADVESLMREGE